MNENKNVIIALVLMLAVWMGFSILFPPQQPTESAPKSEVANEAPSTSPAVTVKKEPAPIKATSVDRAEFSTSTSSPAAVTPADVPVRNLTIDTSRYTAVFSSSGARLVSFKLKDYRSTADPKSPLVQLIDTDSLRYATLPTSGSEGFSLSPEATYEIDLQSDHIELEAGKSQSVHFRSVTSSGLEIVKTFVFKDDHYSIDLTTSIRNLGQGPLTGGLNIALVKYWDDEAKRDAYSFAGPATLVNDKLKEVKVKNLKEEAPVYGKDAAWTSIQSKYFIDVVVPLDNSVEQIRLSRDNDIIKNTLESPLLTLQPGETAKLDYMLFFGPKDLDILKAEGHKLDKSINFGFFEILAKPLLHVLMFFYGFLKNYGLAIILLTIIIKILFWPLTHKSYASMKSMQKLQPEMQKIRERFKSDKERLNKELMELYKKNRVNPMGGCLPMVVQIPVFFALYKVLLGSIALRHAPFAFWLTDLSAKDPYYITPVLMGITMFLQQKLTPTTADPMQAKIMTFLPVVFTFMFLNFPSGLVIYWLVNNLLTIVQQYYIHRKV